MSAVAAPRAPGARARAGGWLRAHPYLALFLLALAARAIVVGVVQVAYDGSLFLDDLSYSRMAEAQATEQTDSWQAYDHWLFTRAGALLGPLTVLYEVFGPSTVLGQAYVAVIGAGVAVLTMRVAAEVLPLPVAFAAGAVLALMPSQVLWSSIILKDALVWAALAGLGVIAALAGRTLGPRLVPFALAAAALLTVLGFLRLHTLVIASWALVIAAVFSIREQRLRRAAGALVVAVAIPWAFGGGPAGIDIIREQSGTLGERRAANALAADSAFVEPDELSGDRPYHSVGGGNVPADIAQLPVGLSAVLLRPYPWEPDRSSFAMRLASIENALWYVLVLLAAVGLSLVWRHRRVLAFPLAAGGAVVITYALTEGNVGTAFRHRGEAVWVFVLLAAFGVERLVSLRRSTRARASITG